MESLGFKKVKWADKYIERNRRNIAIFKIEPDKYDNEKEVQVEKSLKRYDWHVFRKDMEEKEITIFVENERGDEVNSDGVFFHATRPDRVENILRNGLCLMDEGKRNEWRGKRVYLCRTNDVGLFRSLFRSTDYAVFKVDLHGSGIKLYKDEFAFDSYYSLENIPPTRLELINKEEV